MGGSSRDDFKHAGLLKPFECAYEVSAFLVPGTVQAQEPAMIQLGQVTNGLFPVSAVDLALGQLDQRVEVILVTSPQQRVAQHRAQGWAKGQRQARADAIMNPAVKNLDERQATLGDRL